VGKGLGTEFFLEVSEFHAKKSAEFQAKYHIYFL
jgi:hypothetical protein